MKYFVDYLPITTDNKCQLYIDGEDYCKELYNALLRAKKFVFLTGLHFMADFRLIRSTSLTHPDAYYSLSNVLSSVGQRGVEIYLLVNQFWQDEMEPERSC